MKSPMRSNTISAAPYAFTAAIGLALAAASPSSAVDFIRGDANSDGAVSISDSHFLLNWLFRGAIYPECYSAADADDTEVINISDSIWLLNHLFRNGNEPPAPYPAPGPDPTSPGGGESLRCNSYGSGSPLEDPGAGLAILDAIAPGGEDGTVEITIALSASGQVAGYSGVISSPGAIFGDVKDAFDLSGTLSKTGFQDGSIRDGKVQFGYLSNLIGFGPWIPPGQDLAVLRLSVCLKPGLPAGEYPLTLEAGELVDAESARAIPPALASGTLRVLADLAPGAGCSGPGDPPPPPPPPPENIEVTFRVGSATAAAGQEIDLPFIIKTNIGVQGYSFSADFDEEVLQALEVVDVFPYPRTPQEGFKVFDFNNQNANPGSAGVDEGFIIGAEVFSFHRPIVLPPDEESIPVRFRMQVNPGTTAATTEVRFMDGGKGRGQPVQNAVSAYGTTYIPELGNTFIFLSGFVKVIDDITTFIRGDSNGDGAVDITDATVTLDYLFLGGGPPHCYDAADANDDGDLDIGDPVATLYSLFLGTGPLPPPSAPGEDPTPDSMGCLFK